MAEDVVTVPPPNCCARFKSAVKSPEFKIYCSQALSAWGDRMWFFTLSMGFFYIYRNLQLPAISNLLNSVAVLVFGALVGVGVDCAPRLTAARWSLLLNNVAVALSAGTLVTLLHWDLGRWLGAAVAAALVLCAGSCLASTANKIVVCKDWIVVICRNDKDKLANMNSMMVRIDMTAMILSPLLAGQMMAWKGVAAGCLFVAVWNLVSFPIELLLLWNVYSAVPELAIKNQPTSKTQQDELDEKAGAEPGGNEALLGTDKEETPPEPVGRRPTSRLLAPIFSLVKGWFVDGGFDGDADSSGDDCGE